MEYLIWKNEPARNSKSNGVTPISNLSLCERTVDHLRNDISCFRSVAGDHRQQVVLACRFGVSRPHVREALISSKNEGLLDGRKNIEAKAARRSRDSIRELIVSFHRRVEISALRSCFSTLTAAVQSLAQNTT